MEIPRGRGDLKAKLLKGQYEAIKLEFPGGCGGAKQKTFREGSMDIFWNYTMFILQAEKEECQVFSIQDITREEFKQGTSIK